MPRQHHARLHVLPRCPRPGDVLLAPDWERVTIKVPAEDAKIAPGQGRRIRGPWITAHNKCNTNMLYYFALRTGRSVIHDWIPLHILNSTAIKYCGCGIYKTMINVPGCGVISAYYGIYNDGAFSTQVCDSAARGNIRCTLTLLIKKHCKPHNINSHLYMHASSVAHGLLKS